MKNLIDREKVIELIIRRANENRDLGSKHPDSEFLCSKYVYGRRLLMDVMGSIEVMPIENPPDIENKSKLTKDEITANRKHNQQYLNLDDTEILLHEKLMETNMSLYPNELIMYLDKEHSGESVCGDAISCWIAHWIKTLRDKPTEKSADIPDKRCGTCNWFPLKDSDIGCHFEHHIHRHNIETHGFDRYEMRENDGRHCSDWKEKTKEKRRVWTCLNCGKDITYPIATDIVVNEHAYFHWSKEFPPILRRRCSDNYDEPLTATNLAIPKPDSERWIHE